MVLQDAGVDRYENALLSISFRAGSIELYDAERIWVAEDISFTQFSSDGSLTIESEGFAGLMFVDDDAEIYSLGNNTSVNLISEKLSVKASDLRWSKKTNRLSGSRTGEVEIQKDDGSIIRGTGFYADTLKRAYEFEKTVSGQLVTGKPEIGDASTIEEITLIDSAKNTSEEYETE